MLKNSSLCLYSSNLGTFWLKIEQFWQNCSILSQKVPKFELYKHNDELFNISNAENPGNGALAK
jgi:hypothetical protein